MDRPKTSPRGTLDILPSANLLWQDILHNAYKIFYEYGYGQIQTPIFEHTEIFLRSAGDSSDIVNKELYTFLDRSDRSLSLRPEGTAGVVRAYLSNGLDRQTKPVKLYYHGPMFRYERSQTGRYRQFHQLGCEVFGATSSLLELESIQLVLKIFRQYNLHIGKDIILEINTLGDQSSRNLYKQSLVEFAQKHHDKLCSDCHHRLQTNPLRILDCKVPHDQALYAEYAPKLANSLSSESIQKRDSLFQLLDLAQIPYQYSQNLVRGLDYYNDIVFEIKYIANNDLLGQQNTICAGGHYDNLIHEFGGDHTPAFGWAIGIERLVLILQYHQHTQDQPDQCYILNESPDQQYLLKTIENYRNQGYQVYYDYEQRSSNKQFQQAKKLNINTLIKIDQDGNITEKNI